MSFLNGLRRNDKAYLRVWRSDAAYSVQGQDLPDPPPSVSMILAQDPGLSVEYCVVARVQGRGDGSDRQAMRLSQDPKPFKSKSRNDTAHTWMAVVLAAAAFASTTTTWEMNTYQDFLRGRFSNVR